MYLFLDGLESVVGGGEAVAVGGQPGAGVRLDQRKRRPILLPGNLKKKLRTRNKRHIISILWK